jgi:hypothetical protein
MLLKEMVQLRGVKIKEEKDSNIIVRQLTYIEIITRGIQKWKPLYFLYKVCYK